MEEKNEDMLLFHDLTKVDSSGSSVHVTLTAMTQQGIVAESRISKLASEFIQLQVLREHAKHRVREILAS